MLYQEYRPTSWDDFVGQDKAAARVRRIIERQDFDRGAFWIEAAGSNNSGIGKTTLAWIIARQLADDFFITELDGGRCDKRAVEDMERASRLTTWSASKRAKCWTTSNHRHRARGRFVWPPARPVPFGKEHKRCKR